MTSNLSYSGFKAIPVKYDSNSSAIRWFFTKQHSVREKIPEKPIDRTLFVVNVPPFCNELSLKLTFGVCGPVREVYCHASPCTSVPPKNTYQYFPTYRIPFTYKVAYIVFENPSSLRKALKLDSSSPPLLLSTGNSEFKSGLSKWDEDYNKSIVQPVELRKEINHFMKIFDAQEKLKEHEAEMAGEPDEEGWVTVTNKNKKSVTIKTAAKKNKILEKEKFKRSQKELKNFYRFQIRESKMKHLETLRRKFEEDKKKINAMKQRRKFKPF